MPAAIHLTCPGPLTNPKLTLRKGDTTVGAMDLNGISIGADENLIFSTKFGNIGVWRDDLDLVPELDLLNNNFFDIPVGQTCTLTLESDSDIQTTATIQLYEYYRSV